MSGDPITISIQAGASVPRAVPAAFIDAIDNVTVRQVHEGASTFHLVLNADVPNRLASDLPIIGSGTAAPGSRVKIAMKIGSSSRCLIDGVVVHQELAYRADSGTFTYSLIGEDLSAFMRLEEKSAEWPGRSCAQIAREIIESYSSRGMTASIVTPQSDYAPAENQWLYRQSGNDLDYLRTLGRMFGHVFVVRPGKSADDDSTGYWGPPARDGKTMPAFSVSMGAWSNVESIEFNYDADASQSYKGTSRSDAEAPQKLDVQSPDSFGLTKFAQNSSSASALRRTIRYVEPSIVGALATAYADALLQETTRSALRVRATIDGPTYGDIITPATQVPVRGVGASHDGLYYVERVEHKIARGKYTQEVVMTREGLGSTIRSAK